MFSVEIVYNNTNTEILRDVFFRAFVLFFLGMLSHLQCKLFNLLSTYFSCMSLPPSICPLFFVSFSFPVFCFFSITQLRRERGILMNHFCDQSHLKAFIFQIQMQAQCSTGRTHNRKTYEKVCEFIFSYKGLCKVKTGNKSFFLPGNNISGITVVLQRKDSTHVSAILSLNL